MEPLSFEQALAIGRGGTGTGAGLVGGGGGGGGGGGRQLPSPMPNGYKPGADGMRDSARLGGRRAFSQRPVPGSRGLHGDEQHRHSDSDEDDWC